MIDNCLGVTAIGLDITGVGLLSTIVAAPSVLGIESVSIVMELPQVVGNQANKKLSLKIEEYEKIAMLAVSSLNTISSLISKHYQMTPFQMKNIHSFYGSFKRLHELKTILEKNLRRDLKKRVI